MSLAKTPTDQELSAMAHQLEQSGRYKVLTKLTEPQDFPPTDGSETFLGAFVDVETTGLDPQSEEIIELAILPFRFGRDGTVFEIGQPIEELNQPSKPIPNHIRELTGISDELVKGKRFNLDRIGAAIHATDLIIAHNASFDRQFLERLHAKFESAAWACSMTQINWAQEGIESRKLKGIANEFGFFFDGHRAVNDCYAGLEILRRTLPKSGQLALSELLNAAASTTHRVWARGAPFEKKDVLKSRGYRWNGGEDGRPKSWFKDLDTEELPVELDYLAKEVFGRPVKLRVDEVTAFNRFSNRV